MAYDKQISEIRYNNENYDIYAVKADSAIKDGNGNIITSTYLTTTGNAASATKATQDGNGRNIVSTYLTTTGNAASATKATQDGNGRNIASTYLTTTGNAASATKATQDGNGNVISDTYLKKDHGYVLANVDFGTVTATKYPITRSANIATDMSGKSITGILGYEWLGTDGHALSSDNTKEVLVTQIQANSSVVQVTIKNIGTASASPRIRVWVCYHI